MNRSNPLSGDFKEGGRVRVVDSCTAPDLFGKVGTVGKPDAKYKHRVAVLFYLDRDFREVFFQPSEIGTG